MGDHNRPYLRKGVEETYHTIMALTRKRLFFFLIFIFLTTSLLADILVLKNGKKVEGSLIYQDDEVFQLRDTMGIIITVKKSQIDQEATRKLNEEQKKLESVSEPPKQSPQSKPQEVGVADLAREAREKKLGKARTLRKEDLEKMPELSIIGTEDTGEKPTEPKLSETPREKTEEDWKSETRRFANALRRAQDDAEIYGKKCDDLGKQAAYAITDPTQYILVNGVLIPIGGSGYDASIIQRTQEVCFQAEQANKQLERLQKELDEFQEQARREGALPGWVDPERLP